jgi:hypothetical protein
LAASLLFVPSGCNGPTFVGTTDGYNMHHSTMHSMFEINVPRSGSSLGAAAAALETTQRPEQE